MMWVAITLATLTLLVFLGCILFVLVNQLLNSNSVESLAREFRRNLQTITEAHVAEVAKLIDGPKQPEVMLPPEQASKAIDEEWLNSPDSLIEQGDDLSPVYDADEAL